MAEPRDAVDRGDELAPARTLRLERLAAGGGELVVALAPLPRLLHPAADDPAAVLHLVQQRVERGDVEVQDAARARLDELLHLVAVAGLGVEQGEDEELGAPL